MNSRLYLTKNIVINNWLSNYKIQPQLFYLRKYCDEVPGNESQKIPEDSKNKAKKKMSILLKSLSKTTSSVKKNENLKLAEPSVPKRITVNKIEVVKDPIENAQVVQAAKNVAEELGGDVEKTEQDLLKSFKAHSSKSNKDLISLLAGMTISRSKEVPYKREDSSQFKGDRTDYRRQSPPQSNLHNFRRENRQQAPPMSIQLDSNTVPRLNIFPENYMNENDNCTSENFLETWDSLENREIKLASCYEPRNGFEEMIQWTEQGKLWTFPIDNEFGLEEEKKVHFSEHIFLDKHLEDWCPQKGPIRHYMELVCNGLSKNPYITVGRKKNVIEWYKNYFEGKREMLQSIGAM